MQIFMRTGSDTEDPSSVLQFLSLHTHPLYDKAFPMFHFSIEMQTLESCVLILLLLLSC